MKNNYSELNEKHSGSYNNSKIEYDKLNENYEKLLIYNSDNFKNTEE